MSFHLITNRVTVGIPTCDRRRFLERAVLSVLAQTYKEIELIIGDDASKDDTAEYVESLQGAHIVKLRQPVRVGMAPNYNHILRAATSEFFLMLNDDDFLEPTAIEKLVRAFQSPPRNTLSKDIGITWCPFINVDASGKPLWTVRGGPEIETSVDLLEGVFNGTRGTLISAVMVRTADSLAVGGYDERAGGLADSANWGKVALLHPYCVCVDEPLMRYTVHRGGMTTTGSIAFWQEAKQREIDDYIAILKAAGNDKGAHKLRYARQHTLANSTVTVLLRNVGSPGWIRLWATEFWRSRKFMLTPFVLKRALKDGRKLLHLRGKKWPPTR